MRIIISLLLILLTYSSLVMGVHDSLKIILPPGQQECFFEEIVDGAYPREVEIFIPENGRVDILLNIYGPLTLKGVQQEDYTNLVLTETVDAVDQVNSESQSFVQEFSPKLPGFYALCVDNSRSHLLAKKIEFNVRVITSDDDGLQTVKAGKKPFHDDEEVDERLKEAIAEIRDGLDTIQEQQRVDRNRLSLHSATNQSSHNSMVADSILETFIFMFSLLFQIHLIRKWFMRRS